MVLKQVFLTADDKGEDKVSAVFHFDATEGFRPKAKFKTSVFKHMSS